MDRETLKKMKEAQEKADEAITRQRLASNSENKEFWENNLEILKNNEQTFLNNLAETKFLIQCYKNKIESM